MRAAAWLSYKGSAPFAGIGQYIHEGRTSKETAAMARLWAAAASEMVIRHPITKVDAEFFVSVDVSDVVIRLNCRGLPDNTDPDHVAGPRYGNPLLGGFGVTGKLRTWPGYEAARIFFLSTFVILQMHEAMEQVFIKSDERDEWGSWHIRVVDPHSIRQSPYHNELLAAVDCGRVERAIAVTLGPFEAKRLLEREKPRAEQDLKNEIEAGDWTE